jgi:hypothetical protein
VQRASPAQKSQDLQRHYSLRTFKDETGGKLMFDEAVVFLLLCLPVNITADSLVFDP